MSTAPPRSSPHDEIDPQLVSLRRRLPVSPVLVASVLAFTLILMWRLRDDLAYSRQPEEPVDLARISDAALPLPDNVHVSFIGEVDAFSPARLRGIQSTGRRLSPVLGTGGRVWIHEPGEAIDVTPTYDGRFAGRLRELDETPFGDTLREHVAGVPPRPRFIFVETVTDRLPAVDVHGAPLATTAETPVSIEERVANVAVVTMVRTDTILDEEGARTALRAAGLAPTLATQTATSWTYEIQGETPATVRARLREARLFGASAEDKVVTHSGRAGDLRVTGEALILDGRAVPRAAIDHIQFLVPQTIPEPAWVLLSGDTPASLWYMPALYAGLAVIAILMMWAMSVSVRHLRKQRAHPPV